MPESRGSCSLEGLLENRRWVENLARNLSRDASRADDIVQETWITALSRSPGNPAALRAWLARVTRNLAYRSRRDEARRSRHELRAGSGERSVSTDDALESVERWLDVVQALLDLREPYRSTLVLHFFEGLSPAEIGRREKIPAATVRARLRRGLEALRRRLRRYAPALSIPVSTSVSTATPAPLTAGPTLLGGLGMLMKAKLVPLAALFAVTIFGSGVWWLRSSFPPAGASLAGIRGEGRVPAMPLAVTSGGESRSEERDGVPPPTSVIPWSGSRTPDSTPESPLRSAAGVEDAARQSREFERVFTELERAHQRHGWIGIKERIASLRGLLAEHGNEALFARLDDEETDPDFLQALLFHLPNPNAGEASSASFVSLMRDAALHEALWERLQDETELSRRLAYLHYFASNARLQAGREGDLVDLARYDAAPEVRSLCLDALGPAEEDGHRQLVIDIAMQDPDEACRAAALRALARSVDTPSRRLLQSSLSDPSERVRAAALEAGARPAEERDFTAYLVKVLREARSPWLKTSALDRLLEESVAVTARELRNALEVEPDERGRRYYRALLEQIDAGLRSPWQIRRLTRRFRNAFVYQ